MDDATLHVGTADLVTVEIEDDAVVEDGVDFEIGEACGIGDVEFFTEVGGGVAGVTGRPDPRVDGPAVDAAVAEHGLTGGPAAVIEVRVLPVARSEGGGAGSDVAIALRDAGVEVGPAIFFEVDEADGVGAASKGARGRVGLAAFEPRVAAVGGVKDGTVLAGYREVEAGGNRSAVLGVDGWVDARVEAGDA